MEEVTKKEEGKKATERPMDSALGRQPAPLSHQGETKATIPQKGAFQEPKVWGPGEAEAGAYCLQDEEALSIPGSAEEDEESEAVQAMALGLELQCRLQLHLDQLEAKAKAAAAARDSSEPALGACGSLTAPDCPQPLACQGSHGEPHIRAQELGAVLGQVPEEVKLGEKGGSESFGEPLWETGWYPREKGEIAAEAWRGLPTSNPTSVCQRRQLHPNLELKGKVPEGASTLQLTHENCSLRNTSSQKPGEALTPLGEQLERQDPSSRTFGKRTVAFKERTSTWN
ncbi:uncharacterized protein LOC114025500 [Vombatus ursinus]|uniref:uncharacterized protein LOC114025500 n=1 Tax=Vombatus ursinus TaxID=29139 RepID=UPI000FFD880A|nr:uncharacterized protein LOC114025500 [Vombatus ursinus]XP_027694731.1 uncharacterized protein LOC114025500 [Vombatus ursinus]